MHPVEGFADCAPDGQCAVVAQDHGLAIAKVAHQRFLFGFIQHDALIVVIGDLQETHGGLCQWQQATLERRYGHRGPAVRMNHAANLGTRGVHGAVNDGPRPVQPVAEIAVVRRGEDVAVMVDLEQARGGDFLVHQAVGVNEEAALFARDARRNVVSHHVGHPVKVHQPVTRGEIDARLPFGVRDFVLERGNLQYAILSDHQRAPVGCAGGAQAPIGVMLAPCRAVSAS